MLALLMFWQIPVTYTDTTWPTYGGNLENTHYQKMVGAMETAPNVKWSYVTGGNVECFGAAVANVDGVAGMEVVIGSFDDKIYCIDGVTGLVKWSYLAGDWAVSAPTIADVDADGNMEVVAGNHDHKIYCLDGVAGTVEWSYVTGGVAHSSPAVANVDGVAGLEVVAGSNDKKVHCLDGVTGTVKWSYITGDWICDAPAVADVDADGDMEVVIASDDRKVYCLSGLDGTVEWSYVTASNIRCTPAVADVDGDGNLEVVIGSYDDKVYCFDGATGVVKWSYQTGGAVISGPAIADMDADGSLEVLAGSYDKKAYCLDGVTGALEWSYYTGGWVHRGISVADIDGDVSEECNLEVLLPNNDTDILTCLNGEDGSVQWTKRLAQDVHDITIADIDSDGCVELVLGTKLQNKIWALDDVGGATDCRCGPESVEESGTRDHPSTNGIEFRVMGSGIYFFTPNAIPVDMELYDVCGKLQEVLYRGVLTKGGHTFVPNMSRSGIYFAVLRTHTLKESLKIVRF